MPGINLFNIWHVAAYSVGDITGIAQLDSASWQNYGDSLNFSTVKPWSDIKSVVIAGNNLVWIPQFYYRKYTPTTGKYAGKSCLEISPTKHDGFKIHPSFMYKGVERAGFFIGAYKNALKDDMLVSIAGVQPSYQKTMQTVERLIDLNNTGGVAGFHNQTFYETSAVNMLLMIEIGTTDAQTKIGRGNADSKEKMNNGSTNATYRGIYDYWGNGWEWVDGITSDSNGTIQIYDDLGNLTYIDTGVKVVSWNAILYIVSMYDNSGAGYDLGAVFLPKEFSESAGSYGDKIWGACAPNLNLIKGGGFGSGDMCGPFALEFDYQSGMSNPAISGRMAKWDI